MGIAILGSIGVAMYRSTMLGEAPAGIPREILDAARDTLGGAVEAAAQLPQALGDALLALARDSFVSSMQTVAIVSAVLAVGAAVWSYLAIRRPSSDDKAAGESWSRSTKVASEA
jgi:DHA2 family multidrug resistance protein-like MFS transporter